MAIGPVMAREKYNFNLDWRLLVGDADGAETPAFDDSAWQRVSLPHAFNEDEAFRVAIDELTDTVSWYRKHFRLPDSLGKDARVFVEFEGVRQGADFLLNGHRLGTHENGVMAVGFELTPFLQPGDNVLAVRIDNDWDYLESGSGTPFQWNNRNFNANYGGIPKNVILHVAGPVYQTLPLFSNLGTTGVYIYASDFDIPAGRARITAESEVFNTSGKPAALRYRVIVKEVDGQEVSRFEGAKVKVAKGVKATLSASKEVDGLHFWSPGYGYLYDVTTELIDSKGRVVDSVTTRTGFRKTEFGSGLIRLNDRVIQLHGYAQRTSNEWPSVGMSVPPWLSDFSNRLMVESGGNIVRWMHVTPWKQDVESCDRVGLPQAMPAGDAEKDCDGRQWHMREELMRDAIIYNRNNPSVIFYESGNFRISPEHMDAMLAIRNVYDPHGGRAIGSREMLDVDNAEYGGEMLYINRSKKHPMWAHEYCRDEALRKYWDNYSYPFHRHGDGPLYRNAKAEEYNQNQDLFAVEMVRRWYDYWRERPGGGDRCSSGGAKIIFSDTNTHFRGAENYRRSGVVDPMRIPKDAFFAHQVMWRDAWVDNEADRLHIVGHWNYPEATVKSVYVVSTADHVELLLNGRSLGEGRRDYHFLHTFDSVSYRPGTLLAIGRDAAGKEVCRDSLVTVAAPARLRLEAFMAPAGMRADGADMALLQVEVVDSLGRRCPLDNRLVTFSVEGPAEWRGGIAQGPDNYILSKELPVECGINRALVRSTAEPGLIRITASTEGLDPVSIELTASPVELEGGLAASFPADDLPLFLDYGPTPLEPSYSQRFTTVSILSAEAGSNPKDAAFSFDDNEKTEWHSGKDLAGARITYRLEREAEIKDIVLKLKNFRRRSYPLEVLAGDELIWSGATPKSLGYLHLTPERPVRTSEVTLRLAGAGEDREAFNITELSDEKPSATSSSPSASSSSELGIIEIEFLE